MPDLNEQGKNIGQKIRLYTTKELHTDSSNINDNPALWRKQDFIADVLLNADEQEYFAPDRKKIEQIKEDFSSKTKIEIDLDSLFNRDWLRTVTNIVYMPASISGSIYTVKKISQVENELLFLQKIKTNSDSSYTLTEFEQLTKEYELENKVELDIKKATEAHLLSRNEEKELVKINNIGYYKPIIENWNDFQFLTFLYDRINGEDNNLVITKSKLELLHLKHLKNYALTPALSDMLNAGLGNQTSDHYIITLFEKHYCSNEILDEVGAILWRKLPINYKNLQQDQLLIIWCRKMIFKSRYNCDVHKYLETGESDQFNRASVELILQQKDLLASANEYGKALLDYYMDRDLRTLQVAERLTNNNFRKEGDAFDVMKSISNTQRGAVDDYLYFAQSSRETISYLVGQIVKSHSYKSYNLDRINDLTNDIHLKPYLLWTLCFWVWEWKPEIIPNLVKNHLVTSLFFSLVKKLTITPRVFDAPLEIKFKITSALFKHILTVLQSDTQASEPVKAKVVFDCLMTVTTPEFQIKGQDTKLQNEIRQDATRLANEIRQEFMDRPDQYPIYEDQIHTKGKFYPGLLKGLFNLVSTSEAQSKYNNGSLDFQYEKISLLLFLSKLSQRIPQSNQHLKLASYDLALAMLNCYLKVISATSISALDYETWTAKVVIPIFSPAIKNLEAVDWSCIFLLLENENLSTKFLNPAGLSFDNDGDEYDQFNRFIMDKLRTQLRVLIITYNQLKENEVELRHRGLQIDSSLLRLQNAILDIATPYTLNEPLKRRFDIFNAIDERPTFRGSEEELIPLLGMVSNNFTPTEREKLINALLRTDRLVRTMKLIETMTSEQDQNLLLTQLNSYNLIEELERISTVNDFQYLLLAVSSYSQFQDKAHEVLKYWEENIAPGKGDLLFNEIKITTYRTKLLQAFQINNLKEIESVEEPEGDVYLQATRIYPKNEKDFYRALYFFKNDDPEKAYSLYNDLVYRKDGDTTIIALNRLASKIKWAEKESDSVSKIMLFTDALSEWNEYQRLLPDNSSLNDIAENLLHNRLVAFHALERYDEFDSAYSGLSYLERVKPGFFEIGVENRLKRKMNPEAIALVKEAEEFHKLKDGTIPQFVKELNDLAVDNHDPETLKDIFSSLLGAQPDSLVKLIPDSVNNGNDVNSYILYNTVATASDMLSKINSIAEIHFEDKYSDQMIFGLNATMKFHHWKVSPARGGFSHSSLSNPGEIDFAVYAANNQELAVFEALNIYGENNTEVKKHSTKIFNYTPSKQGLFLLIYYKGKEVNFLGTWGKYENSIVNIVEFPESYALVQDSFIDLSDKYPNAAVRVGSTSHGLGITLYHVFVNINYKAIL